MATPGEDPAANAASGEAWPVLARHQGGLWLLVLALTALDVLLVAAGVRPPGLAGALSVDPAVAFAGLRGLALALGAAAWWLVPGHLRPAVPTVLAAVTGATLATAALA